MTKKIILLFRKSQLSTAKNTNNLLPLLKFANKRFSHLIINSENLDETISIKSNKKYETILTSIENSVLINSIPIYQLPIKQNVIAPIIGTAEEFIIPKSIFLKSESKRSL